VVIVAVVNSGSKKALQDEPIRKAQFGQTLRYFKILTSLFRQTQHIAFTKANSGIEILKTTSTIHSVTP